MKAMVIGISPNYNYPGTLEKWSSDNTFYASNLGASLIVRSIMKEFDADYIDDFSDITSLRSKYDTCIMGLATHAHASRDISNLVDILEKLDMKVVVLSLGVSDYVENATSFYKLHSSVIRLLELASASTEWIGVRGPYTASILHQNGFKNVVPIGCPTVYSNLLPEFNINLKESYSNPLIVYHRTIVGNNFNLIKGIPLLGQDYEDEAFFTDNLSKDKKLQQFVNGYFKGFPNEIINKVKEQGVFTTDYNEWYQTIAKHDFVFGPRLHGCIASLLQGVPAILTPRDLRVREISEFFSLPNIPFKELKNLKIQDVYEKADFEKFQHTYKMRYNNFLSFIDENKLDSKLQKTENNVFTYSVSDTQSFTQNTYSQIRFLMEDKMKKERRRRFFRISYYRRNLKNLLKKMFNK